MNASNTVNTIPFPDRCGPMTGRTALRHRVLFARDWQRLVGDELAALDAEVVAASSVLVEDPRDVAPLSEADIRDAMAHADEEFEAYEAEGAAGFADYMAELAAEAATEREAEDARDAGAW